MPVLPYATEDGPNTFERTRPHRKSIQRKRSSSRASRRAWYGCGRASGSRIRQVFHRAELSGTADLGQGSQRFQRHIRGGRGYYQEWGKEPVELNPGDVVYVAPETKHWHGAAPDSDFAHIAIMNAVDGASNEWLEPVEAEYDALR